MFVKLKELNESVKLQFVVVNYSFCVKLFSQLHHSSCTTYATNMGITWACLLTKVAIQAQMQPLVRFIQRLISWEAHGQSVLLMKGTRTGIERH